jgi:hypothetical protein
VVFIFYLNSMFGVDVRGIEEGNGSMSKCYSAVLAFTMTV